MTGSPFPPTFSFEFVEFLHDGDDAEESFDALNLAVGGNVGTLSAKVSHAFDFRIKAIPCFL